MILKGLINVNIEATKKIIDFTNISGVNIPINYALSFLFPTKVLITMF